MPLRDRTSRAVADRRPAGLARTSALGTSPSPSVDTRPAVSPSTPEASTKGRSDSARAAAHGLHGSSVGRGGGGEVATPGHLVLKRQVDHPVGVGGRLGQAVGVGDVASVNDGASRFQPLRRCFGAGQADHIVPGSEQLGHDCRADPARCAGDKDSHDGYLRAR